LVLFAFAFAWSMGAHYTGACMGMPHAAGSVKASAALWLMAPLTLLGAAFLSGKVLVNVGHNILAGGALATGPALAAIAAAFLLTALFNKLLIPTSTIQILVFSLIGAGLAAGAGVRWDTVGRLAVLWALAPVAACGLGWLFTRLFDALPGFAASGAAGAIGKALVLVGAAASLTMGANDVSNATAVFVSTGFTGPFAAGVVGGLGLALGVLTWGRPLLKRVAFDIVKLDLSMATAAQLVQALVVLSAVFFGYFTSMNQALVGALAGAGLARGRRTIDAKVVKGILRGWAVGPAAGLALGFALSLCLRSLS
jgi:PiT family inorganic phosphate transporter